MHVQINEIRFRFDDEKVSYEQQQSIIDKVRETVWEADDDLDLIDEINEAIGWEVSHLEWQEIDDDINPYTLELF